MPHVTVIDVARHAGVSKSTVSNVVRGNAVVAPATKAKVEASVRALGYRPNSVARALRERATKVLALVVPDAVNPFYAQLAHGMERRARREGFGVLVAHTGCDPSTELAQVTALMSRRADGVLLGGLSHSSTLHLRLLDEGVPVVCGFAADDERFGVIDTDDATGMAAIVDHLGGPGSPACRVRRAGLRGGRRGTAQDGLRGGGGEPGHDGRRARGRARPPWSRTTTPSPSASWTGCTAAGCACRRTCRSPATTTSRWPPTPSSG